MSYILYYKKDNTIRYTDKNNVLDELYYLQASIPTIKQIEEYKLTGSDQQVLEIIDDYDTYELINEIKDDISRIDNKVPLYDTYTKNLYLIHRSNVYNRVIYNYYRFPDEQLIDIFKTRKEELKPEIEKLKELDISKVNYKITHNIVQLQREYRKLELLLEFLGSFNISILETTYIKVFYFYANEVGKNITVCLRPSFLPHFKHIKPYYTRSELINLALNLELIKPSDEYYTAEKVMELCSLIKQNDIDSSTILDHQIHIILNKSIGLVQYYSIQGSYFINRYLRGLVPYKYKNPVLDKVIVHLWELIQSAPAFDRSYILYRFIHDDSYLKHLRIGDIFTDPSFISTTRDPFYRSDTYKFGFILIKIKIPANIKGIGLCIESYSNFPEEQEIILPPLSKLKLVSRDRGALYYHTDERYASEVERRYEFEYVGNEEIRLPDKPLLYDNEIVDFMQIEKSSSLTLAEKIRNFIINHVNTLNQFKTKIGKKIFDVIVERYDSTSVYNKFYEITTSNGFSMYIIINEYIELFIELGEKNNKSFAIVNYYLRYTSTNLTKEIDDNDLVEFLSGLGYYFNVEKMFIYTDYLSCDMLMRSELITESSNTPSVSNTTTDELDIKFYYGGNYNLDFYNYIKNNEKRFNIPEIKPRFRYEELDELKRVDPNIILSRSDYDEIFQTYNKTYKLLFGESQSKLNLADFYIWMIENQCINLDILLEKTNRLYTINNPFEYDYYIFNVQLYLYNKGIISSYIESRDYTDNEIIDELVPKNEYRLQYYRKSRIGRNIS